MDALSEMVGVMLGVRDEVARKDGDDVADMDTDADGGDDVLGVTLGDIHDGKYGGSGSLHTSAGSWHST